MCGASPGELLPPVAPEEPPAVEDEVCTRLERRSTNVPAELPQESGPALIQGVAAHGVKQDVAALVHTHVDNLREVVADTPEEARHRAQDALVLAISVGTQVLLERALVLRRESTAVVPVVKSSQVLTT